MRIIISYCVLFVLFGCRSSTEQEFVEAEATDSAYIEQIDQSLYSDEFNEDFIDTTTLIQFDDFSVILSRMIVHDEEGQLQKPVADSIRLWAELGEQLENQLIQIHSEYDYTFVVEFCYQTSVSIAGDGPHCDLIDWKHYTSDWIELEQENQNEFKIIKLSKEEKEKFPDVDMQELEVAALEACGEGWAELVGEVDSPIDYPCWVGVSSHFIRISYSKDSEITQKIIRIDLPMGC